MLTYIGLDSAFRFGLADPKRASFAARVFRLSTALPQFRQRLQAAIAIGGSDAGLGLEVADCLHGVVADAAVRATGIEASRGQALLHLLHFGERQRALRPREGMNKRRSTEDAIAEMADRERVAHGGIVALHRIEVWSQQERRSA